MAREARADAIVCLKACALGAVATVGLEIGVPRTE